MFAAAPAPEPCCDQPRQRRIVLDLRAMPHTAPPELGAFVVYQCGRGPLCKAGPSGTSYLLHHLPRADLAPCRFAACTFPSHGGPSSVFVAEQVRWMCDSPESLERTWPEDGPALVEALYRWRPAPRPPSDVWDLHPLEAFDAVRAALALDITGDERSGGPALTQCGGWIQHCQRCGREEPLVFQTQAFTADNTTLMFSCPDHPEGATVYVTKL